MSVKFTMSMGRWEQVRVFLSLMDHFVNFRHPEGSDFLPMIATCNFRNSRFYVAKRKLETTLEILSRKEND